MKIEEPKRCSDCIAHGGDWECDHMHCRKGRLLPAQSERLTGHWIRVSDGYTDYFKCSECGELSDYEENFCCECGSYMRGKQDEHEIIKSEFKQKCWIPPKGDEAAKRLNDLIFDINPAEICSQIESDNLRNWCEIVQTEMKMAFVQLPCWAERLEE